MSFFWWNYGAGATAGSSPVQVATPTLTLVDLANGTGATATISGATAGTTNTIYGADWSGQLDGAAWASLGSRTGDGTISLSVANGYHWAYVLSTDGVTTSISLVVGYRTTSGEDSVLYQILEGVQATCQAMTFTDIDPTSVYVRKLPVDRDATKPAILIYPLAEQQPQTGDNAGTNLRDGYGYGIGLVLVQKSNQDKTTNLDRLTLWRQQVNRAFRNGRSQLSGVAEITGVMAIEPGAVIVPDAWKQQFDVSSLTLRVWTREVRGVS